MANSVDLAVSYAKLLDEKYKKGSLTSILEVNDAMVGEFDNSGTVKLMNIVTAGLGDYSRSGGFPEGDVDVSWQTHTISNDRGRSFSIDAMDDAEANGIVFVETAKQFMTQHVIPEIDTTRFAKMVGTAGKVVAEALADGDAYLAAIDAATLELDDNEIPDEGRILYVSNAGYSLLKNAGKITRQFDVDVDGKKVINRDFEYIDKMRVIKVPSSRFYETVTLGTDGYTVGGAKLNFIIVHTNAVKAIARHQKVRVFTADVNQIGDAFKYQYRIYHDLIVPANAASGIYVSKTV